MKKSFLLLPMLAVVLTMPKKAASQSEGDRKVSIEITTTENGNTTTKNIDLENATQADIEEALRELGIMDHFSINGDEENLVIDIRRFGPGEPAEGVHVRPVPPAPPLPPVPPTLAPNAEKYTWLGVNTEKLTEEVIARTGSKVKGGVHVLEVMDGSPAKVAGLMAGDVITAVEGAAVTDPKALSDAIRSRTPGEKVKITYYRDHKKNTVNVELAEREARSFHYDQRRNNGRQWHHAQEPRAFLGVTPGEGEEENGAAIGSVEQGSAAQEMGLQAGDVIRSVNGEAIENFDDLSRKIGSMQPGDEVTLRIDRNGREQELNGELGEREFNFNFNFEMPDGEHFHFDLKGFDEEQKDHFRNEMEKLKDEMEKLREELQKDLRSETRITIESRKLTDEEKELLKAKGVKGLDNELDLGDLSTFPNPSNGFFRIHFDVPTAGDLEVDVHDAAGERIYQERITGFSGRYERTLDLSDKASGTYYLVVRQNGQATTRKLVKH